MAELGLKKNEFKDPLLHWIDARLPFFTAMQKEYREFPTPKNFNYFWNFGALATVALFVMIGSGVFLAMNYDPNTNDAFQSVQRIMREVEWGWLMRYIHMAGVYLFFAAVYVHIFRGIYYGSYKKPRELIWILGVVMFMLMMATAFMGYTLPWDQLSYWGATVITNVFSPIPLIGPQIHTWVLGGFAVGNPTLNRFFSLHYLLPFIILGVLFLHVMALHTVGSNNPLGIDVKGPQDTVPFHPYYTVKDSFGVCIFLLIWAILVFFLPHLLAAGSTYIPADPLKTPPDITPEWYFLPFYAILRSVPNKLGGVVLLFGSVLVLFFLPVLDTSPVRSCRFRPVYKWFFLLFVADVFLLGYIGANKPIGIFILLGRLATAFYFIFWLFLMPLLGKLEKPLPLPVSISRRVLGDRGGPVSRAAATAHSMEKV